MLLIAMADMVLPRSVIVIKPLYLSFVFDPAQVLSV